MDRTATGREAAAVPIPLDFPKINQVYTLFNYIHNFLNKNFISGIESPSYFWIWSSYRSRISMSVIARLEVIPTREGNMSEAVASAVGALDRFDVGYETTPTDTVIEAVDPAEVFAAAEAAHRAVADERVITSLEVDEHRGRPQNRHERVAAVERALGRPPERERPGAGTGARQHAPTRGGTGAPQQASTGGETELRRYHGPVQTDQGGGSQASGPRSPGSGAPESRYLQTQQSPPR
jgi:uncharacterized protein YqgV (UPF0045/DUF77 family)